MKYCANNKAIQRMIEYSDACKDIISNFKKKTLSF